MKINAQCQSCERAMQIEAHVAAARPQCMYCGGALQFDETARQQLAEAAQQAPAPKGAKALSAEVRRVNCPICGHQLGFRNLSPGSPFTCNYCSCAFEVPEPDREPLPSPPGQRLHDATADPAAVAATRAELGIEQAFPGGADALHPLLAAAVRALFYRRLRGHGDAAEGQLLLRQLYNVSVMREPGPDGWVCPLRPASAADLLTRIACPELNLPFSLGAGELEHGVVVRITTGEERKTKANVNAKGILTRLAVSTAVSTLTAGLLDPKVLKKGDVDVGRYSLQHFLKVELQASGPGTELRFSHELATGEPQPLDDEQRALIPRLLGILRAHAAQLAGLQAVFGAWFDCRHQISLTPANLERWLALLGPGLEGLAALISAPSQPAAPSPQQG